MPRAISRRLAANTTSRWRSAKSTMCWIMLGQVTHVGPLHASSRRNLGSLAGYGCSGPAVEALCADLHAVEHLITRIQNHAIAGGQSALDLGPVWIARAEL